MTWSMWLDDQLDDPATPSRRVPEGFFGAKSTVEALVLIAKMGMPNFIDFDFDLGDNDTALSFLYELQFRYPVGPFFDYAVHSRNVYAKQTIDSFVKSWKRSAEM